MKQGSHTLRQHWGIGLALSVSILAHISLSSEAQVNSVHNGRIVSGGTYYNTANGKTTFKNTGPGGLWVKRGTLVRGLEVNETGNLTNQGGTLHFYAPGSVVRIDGKVDVSSIFNGGRYLRNGGKVFIDAAYLHQSGQIYANGLNGGLVQINVGGAAFAQGSSIRAQGGGGLGGVIAINSEGLVHIGRQSIMETSGHSGPNFDRNVINIEAGAIRHEGILRADGVATSNGIGSRGGTIRLIASGNTDTTSLLSAFADAGRLPGNSTDPQVTVSQSEASAWKQNADTFVAIRDGSISLAGDVVNGTPIAGQINATGSGRSIANNNDLTGDNRPRTGDGGTIILAAMKDVVNYGLVNANGGHGASGAQPVRGGNGGTIVVIAQDRILNLGTVPPGQSGGLVGKFQTQGGNGGNANPPNSSNPQPMGADGGSGGLIAFGYNQVFQNKGVVQAGGGNGGNSIPGRTGAGGQGGLMVFSGNANPYDHGVLDVQGGRGRIGGLSGEIVSPNPGTLKINQVVFQRDGGLSGNMSFGTSRPLTEQSNANELLSHAENLILLTRNRPGSTQFTQLRDRGQSAMVRTVRQPKNRALALLDLENKEAFESTRPYRNFILNSNVNGLSLNLARQPVFSFNDFEVGLNQLNTLTVLNNGYVTNTFHWGTGFSDTIGGGRLSILAAGDIENGSGFDTLGTFSGGTIHLASKGSVNNFDLLWSHSLDDSNAAHGGSLMLKANQDIQNFGERFVGSSGTLMGGTQRYKANRDFMNLGNMVADAESSQSQVSAQGGAIYVKAGRQAQIGSDFFNPSTLRAAATNNSHGEGGFIELSSPIRNHNFGAFDVQGSLTNGWVVLKN